jgi:hypothetical protein
VLTTAPTFDHLYDLFPNSPDRSPGTIIAATELPQPYRRLLDHTEHMTVTVEEFHGGRVDVNVLESRQAENEYARKILLALRGSEKIVQFGLVRVDLGLCSQPVRTAILEGKTPLGRILIQNNMLRRIEPIAFLRVSLSPVMAGWFGVPSGTVTYGRIGVIFTNHQPAVEVLEIVAPV